MNNQNTPHPLVSCTVLSYNSAKTITETLDSIAAQTYPEIELIISDDCSRDNTVEICLQWLELNKSRFVRTELITVDKNTGVCANSNRALAACMGEWEKGIAADDILLPNCIEDFVNYIHEHPEAKWVSSYMCVYKEKFKPECCIARNCVSKRKLFDMPAEKQLKGILYENLIAAAPNFYNVAVKRAVGGYDENFSYEDYPFFITLLENGYKCYFLDKETVGYRIHESVSHSKKKLFNYKFLKEDRKVKKAKCFKHMSVWQMFGVHVFWFMHVFIEKNHLNRKTAISSFLYRKLRSSMRFLFG